MMRERERFVTLHDEREREREREERERERFVTLHDEREREREREICDIHRYLKKCQSSSFTTKIILIINSHLM